MVQEVLRWRPPTPTGLPHRSTEDDWHEEMFIQKGTICIPNAWQMNHDPKIYGENVAHFEPARHLGANGEIAPGLPDAEQGHVSFGFGRRQGPANLVANNLMFINIAVTLWATKIERKRYALGNLLPLDVNGFVEQGVVVSADSSHISKSRLTRAP